MSPGIVGPYRGTKMFRNVNEWARACMYSVPLGETQPKVSPAASKVIAIKANTT
jgi:hypothetical protein